MLLFAETCKQLHPGVARPSSAVTVFRLQGHPLSLYFLVDQSSEHAGKDGRSGVPKHWSASFGFTSRCKSLWCCCFTWFMKHFTFLHLSICLTSLHKITSDWITSNILNKRLIEEFSWCFCASHKHVTAASVLLKSSSALCSVL